VIGTLYCAKGNYEFGIGRIVKSLEPYNKKLSMDTWYYAKRCLLSLIEKNSTIVNKMSLYFSTKLLGGAFIIKLKYWPTIFPPY
jgi:hypothetical protein